MVRQSEPAGDGVDTEGMEDYLTEIDVSFAVLFGSHARETADESSDLDIAVRFPERMDERERFRLRNRIDADLQGYAEGFVDVSDIESLPLHVARSALREGKLLVGDEQRFERYRENVETEYEETASQRERDRQEFIERLARGDV